MCLYCMSSYWFYVEENKRLRDDFKNRLITKGEYWEMYNYNVAKITFIMR